MGWLLERKPGGPIPRSQQTGFFFDAAYASFLEEVARQTPPEATVAVLVPRVPDLYRYQAVYLLAPRRIVEVGQIGQAQFVAVYGSERLQWPGGVALPDGTLVRR